MASPPPEVGKGRLGSARLGRFSVVEGAILCRASLVQALDAAVSFGEATAQKKTIDRYQWETNGVIGSLRKGSGHL